jgi:cell division protein FtsB
MSKLGKIRVVAKPEDRLRALVERAPEAEAFAERTVNRFRPMLARVYAARRRLATGGVALLTGWLFLHVVFGANGMVVYKQKRSEYQQLQKEIDSLQKENDRRDAEIQNLKSDPETIEKEAREQLHYARPGEVVYVSPAPVRPPSAATNAAQK